ncbi:MAG: hypothetical protein ACXAC2_19080 [Candidatus Kariarchaeaceae archaeon]|jgi:hypothetical protein
MQDNDQKQKVGRPEPKFKFGIGTIIWIIIGFIVSWINMIIIDNSMQIWSYLTIIFTTIIPGVIVGLKDRYWGYGYMIGFAFAGIPFLLVVDLFIGGYVFATAIFIFVIVMLIFWMGWRSISGISRVEE